MNSRTVTTGNSEQYGDSRKLAARARLNSEYTVAKTGWFSWIAGQLPLKSGDRVLDIGCGPGWFWKTVADKVPERLDLTLTDLSAGMVREAAERCENLSFGSVASRTADASDLPFEDGGFDGVVAMHMLYHVSEPEGAIAEAYRVLQPGGWFAATTNGKENLRELYELTTAFGGSPSEPVAEAFGFEAAERMLQAQFGNVAMSEHPAHMHVTDPEDVFLALTSYPPGDRATDDELEAFCDAIAAAFDANGGALTVRKQSALFLCRK